MDTPTQSFDELWKQLIAKCKDNRETSQVWPAENNAFCVRIHNPCPAASRSFVSSIPTEAIYAAINTPAPIIVPLVPVLLKEGPLKCEGPRWWQAYVECDKEGERFPRRYQHLKGNILVGNFVSKRKAERAVKTIIERQLAAFVDWEEKYSKLVEDGDPTSWVWAEGGPK